MLQGKGLTAWAHDKYLMGNGMSEEVRLETGGTGVTDDMCKEDDVETYPPQCGESCIGFIKKND